MCGSAILHEAHFSMNDHWHVGQEIRHIAFQESFVFPPCKPVWKYVGSEKMITTNTGPDIDGEPALAM
jgi:hypothetical protein